MAASPWRELFAPVEQQLARTELLLAEIVESRSPTVREVVNHTLGAGGKRLRPALVLLCAQACGAVGERAVRLAAAVELLHSGSLLHDDVFDGSESRRGGESAWRRWGTSAAVLVGDFVAATVYKYLSEQDENEAMGILAETVGEMCQGELLSLECSNELDESTHLEIVAGKTAALFSASCLLGSRAGTASDTLQAALAAYGRNLGMAFQITDDLLDLYGDSENLGKSVGQDQDRGLLTLAVIHALENDESGQIAELVDELAAGHGDVQTVASLAIEVEEVGGRDYAEQRARAYAASAQEHLQLLPASPSRDALDHIPAAVLRRIM